MYKSLIFVFIIGFLFAGCKEKSWYRKIERLDYEQVKNSLPPFGDDILRLASQEPDKDLSKMAFEKLLNTPVFTTAYEGDGNPSRKVLSYHILMENPDRKELFLELLKRARKAGQVYALIALSEIDYETFAKKINKFATDTTKIERWDHDLFYYPSVAEVVVSGWSRNNLLKGQSPSEWLLQNPPAERDSLPGLGLEEMDVLNGGFKEYYKVVMHYLD